MHYITLILFKSSLEISILGKVKIWKFFFPWIFFYFKLILLSICKCEINEKLLFFTLYSFNISHSNQNASFFSWSRIIINLNLFKIYISAYYSDRTHTKVMLTFFFFWFYHCYRRYTCVWFWWQIQST